MRLAQVFDPRLKVRDGRLEVTQLTHLVFGLLVGDGAKWMKMTADGHHPKWAGSLDEC